MDTTDGFVINLFRPEKPALSNDDFNNTNIWVCDLLNDEPELVNDYITYRLQQTQSSDQKLSFLYDCRHCFKCGLNDLKKLKIDPDTWFTCCNGFYANDVDKGIKVYEDYLEKVEMAICHLTDCESLKCPDTPKAEKGKPNPENTTARQVMAMYYIAEHLGILGQVDKSNLESFTEFLTGKSRSEIHKKFKSPLDNKQDPNEKKKDFRFVKDHFEKLGLRDIVGKINKDMS